MAGWFSAAIRAIQSLQPKRSQEQILEALREQRINRPGDSLTVYRGGPVNPNIPLTYTSPDLSQARAYSDDAGPYAGAVFSRSVDKNRIASEEEVRETLAELGFPQVKTTDRNHIGGMVHEYLDPRFKYEGFYLGDGVDAMLAKALRDKGFDAYKAIGNDATDGGEQFVQEIVLVHPTLDFGAK